VSVISSFSSSKRERGHSNKKQREGRAHSRTSGISSLLDLQQREDRGTIGIDSLK